MLQSVKLDSAKRLCVGPGALWFCNISSVSRRSSRGHRTLLQPFWIIEFQVLDMSDVNNKKKMLLRGKIAYSESVEGVGGEEAGVWVNARD